MKTTIYLDSKNCSELENIGLRKLNISIRLDDECKNRHEDFSLMGSGWSINNYKLESDIGGCIHEEILKVRPDLKPFADLHLCTSKGIPMHAIVNGFYWLQENKKDVLISHLRITEQEYEVLKNSEDKTVFQYHIENLKLPERWQKEANEAIKMFENMTGETYKDNSTKETFTPLTIEQRNDIETKLQSGFYSPENIAKRNAEKKQAAKDKAIEDLTNNLQKEIHKLQIDYKIKCKIIALFGPEYVSNVIFYDHSRELVFNWNNSCSYNKSVTPEQFEHAKRTFEKSRLWLDGEIKEIKCKGY